MLVSPSDVPEDPPAWSAASDAAAQAPPSSPTPARASPAASRRRGRSARRDKGAFRPVRMARVYGARLRRRRPGWTCPGERRRPRFPAAPADDRDHEQAHGGRGQPPTGRRRPRRSMPLRVAEQDVRPGAPSRRARHPGCTAGTPCSDRQPQPMQPARLSRSRSSMAMRASSCGRHDADRRSQSRAGRRAAVGQRRQRGADVVQAQADLLGDAHERHAPQRVAVVAALAAARALGVDQALGLVEAQRRRRRRRCAC